VESDGYTLRNRSKREESGDMFDMSPINAKQLLKIEPRTKFEKKFDEKVNTCKNGPLFVFTLSLLGALLNSCTGIIIVRHLVVKSI